MKRSHPQDASPPDRPTPVAANLRIRFSGRRIVVVVPSLSSAPLEISSLLVARIADLAGCVEVPVTLAQLERWVPSESIPAGGTAYPELLDTAAVFAAAAEQATRSRLEDPDAVTEDPEVLLAETERLIAIHEFGDLGEEPSEAGSPYGWWGPLGSPKFGLWSAIVSYRPVSRQASQTVKAWMWVLATIGFVIVAALR